MEAALTDPASPSLSALFYPRSVAVVGVSADPRKQGSVVLRNLVHGGFQGKIYGVSRNLPDKEGVPCFGAPADLPESVDLAFIALPADAAAASLGELAAAGTKFAIVGAAGFAEDGDEEGIARQAELTRIARDTGIHVVGPNCNGIYNANGQLSVGFNTAHSKRLRPGNVAIFSHSGALFDVMIGQLAMLGAGLSVFASVGNEANLDLLDYLEFAIADQNSQVVALLLDSLSNGNRFRRLADRARRCGKHIVVLKIGTSALGAEAATAHSSRLAGNAEAYAALFDASGVTCASSLEGLMTAAALLSSYGKAQGGLAALSSSGAGASLLADLAVKHGIRLAALSRETRAEISGLARFSRAANPTDLGIFQGAPRREEVPSLIASDPDVGMLVALVQSFRMTGHPLLESFVRAREASGKPFLVIAPGDLAPEERERFVRGGLRVLADTESTLQGVAAMLAEPRDYPERPTPQPRMPAADEPLLKLKRPLSEPESLTLLARFGIDAVATRVLATADEAIAAAEELGWPVAMKAVAEGVAHKSDLGLVRLGLGSATAVSEAHRDLGSPPRVVVQPQVKGRLEAIIGVTRAPGVGLTLLAGLGGIEAEALASVTLWPLPTTEADIERKLASSALGRILSSARWHDPASRTALIAALVALQDFALWAGDRLSAVDINPLILGKGRAVAVDALVVPSHPG